MGNPIRYSCPGTIYHIVPTSNNKENIFPDSQCRRYYLQKLKIYAKKLYFAIYCYCIMNTHPHLLIEQLGDISISKIMHILNTSYAMYFNKRFVRKGRLFCCKYKAKLVDTDAYLLEVSRYIHNNPVKAGIVNRPEEYVWSSYRYYLDMVKVDFVNKRKILDILEPVKEKQVEGYKNFVVSDPNLLMLTSHLDRG